MRFNTIAVVLATFLSTGALAQSSGTTVVISGSSYAASQTISLTPSASTGIAPMVTAGLYGVAGVVGLGAAALL